MSSSSVVLVYNSLGFQLRELTRITVVSGDQEEKERLEAEKIELWNQLETVTKGEMMETVRVPDGGRRCDQVT